MYTEKNKIEKKDDGISPVIGVILMVVITVVMATVVSSWSSGVRSPNTLTTIGLNVTRSITNVSVLVTSIDPATAAPLPLLNISYQNWSGNSYYTICTNITNANVGDIVEFNTNNITIRRVIITATFKDNSKKVLFSQEV